MIISLIVAVAENNAIGKNNQLLWHLPIDMKYFKETTTSHYVIMGRKNYESIPEKFRPLPNRTNMIITRNKNYKQENCLVFNSIESAIEKAKADKQDKVFIIGGGQIYKDVLENKLVDEIHLTRVHENFEGDVFFPEIDFNKWRLEHSTTYNTDEKHHFSFTINKFMKK